jgi:hypothetical protein
MTHFHMCNATNGDWAYVDLQYYGSCRLLRYDYADPHQTVCFTQTEKYFYITNYYMLVLSVFWLIWYVHDMFVLIRQYVRLYRAL